MAKSRVLITDGVHPVLPKGLRSLGYAVDYDPSLSLAEVRKRVQDYEGLVINSKITVDSDMLDTAPQLQWVGRLGSGLEIIDLAYAKSCGVAVYSSPAGNAPAVGEHALAMLLSLAHRLRKGDAQVRANAWDREGARGWELKYRTVGIIGYGHTGPAFAKTLQGFGNRVIAYDKYRPDFTADTPWVEAAASAEQVLAEAEVLSLHLPLTSETINYLDATRMDTLREGCVVVNTSRGRAVDLAALVERIASGRLGGACLDVFPNEKPPTFGQKESELMKQLSALEQTVLSPHVAGWTVESKRALAEIILTQVQAHVLASRG